MNETGMEGSGPLASDMAVLKESSDEEYNKMIDLARYNVKLGQAPVYQHLMEHFESLMIEWKRQLIESNFAELEASMGMVIYRVGMLQGHIQCATLFKTLPDVAKSILEVDDHLQSMENDNDAGE
tara:strand:- start:2001 stop:2375 length:375 start_codon:yes stop_codon:yes gene_type:complete